MIVVELHVVKMLELHVDHIIYYFKNNFHTNRITVKLVVQIVCTKNFDHQGN